MTEKADLFRIGPGYIQYWMHEGLEHWRISDREAAALRELGLSLGRLITHRNSVQTARREFLPASSFASDPQPETDAQHGLFAATADFFLNYYSALSALAGVMVRFRDVFGDVPHSNNTRFLAWLEPHALFKEELPILTEARKFRAAIDHKADKQPYQWATVVPQDGHVRAMLHGPAGQSGSIPDGALPRFENDFLPPDHVWTFIAPDEDRVLSVLAVQMNALFPRIQAERGKGDMVRCQWVNRLGKGDPVGGYPVLAPTAGTVVDVQPMGVQISEEDEAAIRQILQKYERDEK